MIDLTKGVYYRKGIETMRGAFFTYERCDRHGRVWAEGEDFKNRKNEPCEECIAEARN
jgi:hypothetical protein